MISRFSPVVFSSAFCITYAAAFAGSSPMFIYYPLHGDFTWGTQVLQGVGPPMLWYGFLANAFLAGALAGICIPGRIANARLVGVAWLFPVGAMLTCIYLLRQLF